MITVDTSALMEIVIGGPLSDACIQAIASEHDVKISAGTVTEALIVARGRNLIEAMEALIEKTGLDIVSVTPASARRAADAYRRWGRGFHPAALNLGDCFAYEVAAAHGGRLLFVGQDFSRTDLQSVLAAQNP